MSDKTISLGSYTKAIIPAVNESTLNEIPTLGLVGNNVKSSNKKVAKATIVDGKIKITSVGEGTTTIEVGIDGSEMVSAKIPVTVSSTGAITLGEITKGYLSIQNDIATLGTIGTSVSSDNIGVATAEIIDGKIKITSVSKGDAIIKVTSPSNIYPRIYIRVLETGKIQITYLSIAESYRYYSEFISNVSEVVVDNNSIVKMSFDSNSIWVTAKSEGTTEVTLKGSNGEEAKLRVTVTSAGKINMTEIVDKTNLINLIDEANGNLLSVVKSADGTEVEPTSKWVTSSVWDAYNLAMGNAISVKDNSLATITDVNSAIGALEDATNTFNAAKKTGTKVVFTSTIDETTSNDIATLGGIGTSVSSNDETVATAKIDNGKIKITSVGKGTATINVNIRSRVAKIPVTVSKTGEITIGSIEKACLSIANNDQSLKFKVSEATVYDNTILDVDISQDLIKFVAKSVGTTKVTFKGTNGEELNQNLTVNLDGNIIFSSIDG